MDAQEFFADTKAAVEKYVQYKLLLLKLQAAEKIAKLSAAMFVGLIIAVISFFIILFVSIMAGWYFADLFGSNYWGFGIITAFYILVLLLIIIFRKKVLEKTVTNTVINIFFEKSSEEHDNTDTTAQ